MIDIEEGDIFLITSTIDKSINHYVYIQQRNENSISNEIRYVGISEEMGKYTVYSGSSESRINFFQLVRSNEQRVTQQKLKAKLLLILKGKQYET